MKRTRLSLYYLASYLLFGGIGMIFFPGPVLELFLSNTSYELTMVRLVGSLMIGLAFIVIQVIRYRSEVLYPTTLLVRLLILVVLVWNYLAGGDPFFLVLIAIVGLGVLITGSSYLSERSRTTYTP